MHGVNLAGLDPAGPVAGEVREALEAIADQAFETCMVVPPSERHCRRGADGFLGLWTEWTGTFDVFVMEEAAPPVEGRDVLVNFARQRARLAGSHAEVTSAGAAAWFFARGRLERIEFHLRGEDALAAAGLTRE